MAYISKYKDTDGSTYDIKSKVTNGILYGHVDASSTATNFTASIPGVTEYYDGLAILLKNGVVTSASGFTLNINGLGAKHSYNNLTAATQDTTIFNINYTMLFIYDSTRVEGGGWICFRGYDANTNTIGYQLRTNSSTLPVSDQTGRYRLLFTSADGSKWVPANTENYTDATTKRDVNRRKIDPFGPIVYYSSTSVLAAGANVGTGYQWSQYVVTLGYSFNRTGAALTMSYPDSVYVKCYPQTDGSAIIDAGTPFVQALPSSEDGYIYIYLGRAYSATAIELTAHHPVYYYTNGAVHLWTNPAVDYDLSLTSLNPVANDEVTKALSLIDNGEFYKRVSGIVKTQVQGVECIQLLFDDGSPDGISIYIPDSTGMSTILSGLNTAIADKQDKIVLTREGGTQELVHNPVEVTLDNGVHGFMFNSGEASDWFIADGIGLDTVLTQVNQAIAAKQDTLTFDTTPTSGSTNPVTSGGVYAMIGDVESLLAAI